MNRNNVTRMIQGLVDLHDQTGRFLDECGLTPKLHSQASKELSIFQRPESVLTAYSQGSILIDVMADQMMAFTKTVIEPAQTIAPWSCVRAVIEASALASWLIDPSLDVRERIQRSLAFRYEGLLQQERFVRATGNDGLVTEVLARIDAVEQVALDLGYVILEDKKGKHIGIAQRMPDVTSVIKNVLDEEANYRLLSAAIHGHPWALQHLSFHQATKTNVEFIEREAEMLNALIFEKNIEPSQITFLCVISATVFVRPIWYKCQLFGWDVMRMARLLDTAFDNMGFRDSIRLWNNR